jgi:hypothetical protein
MNEHIKQAVDYAFDNKISDMQDEINSALLQKVADAISGKRIEVAQNMMSPAVSESDEENYDDEEEDDDDEEDDKAKKKLKGKQKELDKDDDGDIDEKDFEKLRKESLEEAWPKDTHDYTPGDEGDELAGFKGRHMDDHPHYKKVAGYGKYREFGVHKSNGKNPWTVPYIISNSNGEAIYHTNDRRMAHDEAKRESSKAKYPERINRMKESYIEEKLSASDDISVWIKDFIESDNPRFEGKSKEERIQMAKGAYYSAKRAK